MEGRKLLENSSITLHFGAQIEGSAGCNHYQADDQLTSTTIQINTFEITEMACQPDPLMEQEKVFSELFFWAAQGHPFSYQVDSTIPPAQLIIQSPDGQTILIFEAATTLPTSQLRPSYPFFLDSR